MKKSIAISRHTYGRAWNEKCNEFNFLFPLILTHVELCPDSGIVAQYGFYLKGLNEGPEEYSDGVALSEQLNEPRCTKQLQEAHIKCVDGLQEKEKEKKHFLHCFYIYNNPDGVFF